MADHSGTDVDIREVSDRRGEDDFLRVPFDVYGDDPNWIAPLNFERRQAFAPKAPVFEHVTWTRWVACRDGRPVGRISAQIDELYRTHHDDAVGYFGLFECEDDASTAAALFERAEAWLREHGAEKAVGPFNVNINQEVGLLVDGFDTPPYFMMPHGRRYYASLLDACGYTEAQELLAYMMDPEFVTPPVMTKLLERLGERIQIRAIDRREADRELEVLRDIFNDAWHDNWGFVPFTQREFNAIGKEMLLLIPDDFIQIATLDGVPVAFIVGLPNLNEAIADLHGKLMPFGWLKLLKRVKLGYPRTGRVPLMGVRRQYHNTRLGPGLAFAVIDAMRTAFRARKIREIEMSWILSDNMGMRNIIENIGGRISKRYRMYERRLS